MMMRLGTIRKFGSKLAVVLLHPTHHTLGFCNLCRKQTLFVCDVAADRWIRRCCMCRSTPKYRAIVQVIESETGQELSQYIRNHKIYELSTTSPIFLKLRGHVNYEASGYFSDRPFGEKVSSLYWNQDLQNLSFPCGYFDVVISSETMEHVRRPWQGVSEVFRVLKAGGFYVFTIPYRDDRLTTSRVDTSGDEDRFLQEKVYHQDPYRPKDSLVYTDFGADLPELLRPIGFETERLSVLNMQSDIHDDLRPANVFIARKPAVRRDLSGVAIASVRSLVRL